MRLTYGFITGLNAGSEHVDEELATHLRKQFIECEFQEDIDDIIDDALKDFREYSKMNFSSPTDPLKVTIGGRRMNYPRLHVLRGVMEIERYVGFISVS